MLSISFIIIGKNESLNISECIASIQKACKLLSNITTEIIYVDSDSTDDSINIIKENYPNVSIYHAKSPCNAAVVRNIGAKEAKYDYFFFIDGDMEINVQFLRNAIDSEGNILNDFFSGQVVDEFTDKSTSFRYAEVLNHDIYSYYSGGIFIIKKEIFMGVDMFRTKYTQNEEPDLSLRIAKKYKIGFLRKKELICKHSTEKTHGIFTKRFLAFNLNNYHSSSIFLRDHIFNRYAYPRLARTNLLQTLFIASVVVCVFTNCLLPFITYLILISTYSIFRYKKYFITVIFNILTFNVGFIFTFLFYYPKSKGLFYEKK